MSPFRRCVSLSPVVLLVFGALSLASCGGGGAGFAARDMTLMEFLFVDRSLTPTAPTGTRSLPRNAQVLFVFSELVDPASVDPQTIAIRFGPTGSSVPEGSFSVDGNVVRFDPTVTAQGQPAPFGFDAARQYTIRIPGVQDQAHVVRNLDDDPNSVAFFSTFETGTTYLRELVPPEVERVYFVPDALEVNPLTGQVPGNGVMAIEFSEPMDPASFVLGGPPGPDAATSVDVRYTTTAPINIANGLVVGGVGAPIAGYFTHDASATTWFFNPTFSFGDKRYVFEVRVFQGLKDLSGNSLVNPRSFPGPQGFTVDGTGIGVGRLLFEGFDGVADRDVVATDADWGMSESGFLKGASITSRQVYVFGYQYVQTGNRWGQYGSLFEPLIGAALNNVPGFPAPNPPTSQGRRVQWAFPDVEIGASGTVTAAGWGPDSNATFAAQYPNVILRCGHQKSASLNLGPSFAGNYDGSPTRVYAGPYQVTQAANVGNTPGHPTFSHASITPYPEGPGCTTGPGDTTPDWNLPLFAATGFFPWPQFTTYFDWDDGAPGVQGDRVFVFDASVQEGDTWQQIRGYFAATFPCSGVLQPGFPSRRMRSVYEGDSPQPAANPPFGVLNPEPSLSDAFFTLTKRISTAQSLWYTDGLQPANSTAPTFGKASDYRAAQVVPVVQAGGTQVRVEYQACDAVLADRTTIDPSQPFLPGWTSDVDDCDGYANIRWRLRLVGNLVSFQVPRIDSVTVPIVPR